VGRGWERKEGVMAKHRLRKKNRIKVAGKGCNKAQYRYGKPKKKWQE